MGIRVGGRIAGPIYGSVGCGTLLAIGFFGVGAVVAVVVGAVQTVASLAHAQVDWAVMSVSIVAVILLAAFIVFAFWFNHPQQVQRRAQRRAERAQRR